MMRSWSSSGPRRALLLLILLAGLPGEARAGGAGLVLALEPLVGGLVQPLAVVDAGDVPGRLYVVEQDGLIRIWSGAQLVGTPFLNLISRVACCGERGLLGLAFHPDYATNGYFYVSYTDNSGDTVISRFSVSSNPNVADAGSELILIEQAQPATNHNNGNLAFGPDGYLYVGMGDGGPGDDPDDRGQDLDSLLGKVLRIDVDSPDSPLNYGIPDDNPFVGVEGVREEIWVYGLRNPWRFSFDRDSGDLWIGDVGQRTTEEIDHQSASGPGGENYGWRRMEGSECFLPETDCNDGSLTLPVLEYGHGSDCSVTGGFRYRGSAHPRLRGVYLYGDFCSGLIRGTVPRCDGVWEASSLLGTGFSISSFGEDAEGEIYVVDLAPGGLGEVALIVVDPSSGGPLLDAAPETLDFDVVELGVTVSAPLSLTNGNGGAEALTIETMVVSGSGEFTLDLGAGATPCGPLPACLAPGESCTLEVDFVSPAEGVFADTLAISGNFEPASLPLEALAYSACGAPATLPVSEEIIDGPEEFVACARVTVGPDVTVEAGGDARFRAGVQVQLGDGVVVEAGGALEIVLDPLLAPTALGGAKDGGR